MDFIKEMEETKWELVEFLQDYEGKKLKVESEIEDMIEDERIINFDYFVKGKLKDFLDEVDFPGDYKKEVLENVKNSKGIIEFECEGVVASILEIYKIELDLQ